MKKILLLSALAIVVGLLIVFAKVHPVTDSEIDREYATASPWPPGKYASVRAYLYRTEKIKDPKDYLRTDIWENGKLADSVVDKKGIAVNASQVRSLISAISQVPPHKDGVMWITNSICLFDPHHAFVFYDAKENPVATIEICLLCHAVEVWPKRPRFYQTDFKQLDDLFRELELPVFHTDAEFESYRERR